MPRWVFNIHVNSKCELFVIVIDNACVGPLWPTKKVLVHILSYEDNECETNIPQNVKDLVKFLVIVFSLKLSVYLFWAWPKHFISALLYMRDNFVKLLVFTWIMSLNFFDYLLIYILCYPCVIYRVLNLWLGRL